MSPKACAVCHFGTTTSIVCGGCRYAVHDLVADAFAKAAAEDTSLTETERRACQQASRVMRRRQTLRLSRTWAATCLVTFLASLATRLVAGPQLWWVSGVAGAVVTIITTLIVECLRSMRTASVLRSGPSFRV